MCKSPLHPLLAALPKCEQHLHIEGTLEPTLLFQLASKNSIPLPPSTEDPAFTSPSTLSRRYSNFTSLSDFLHYYFIGMSTLVTSSDFESLAHAYFTRAHRDGLVHAEIFFDPQAHTARGVAYATVLSGLEAACRRANTELGISTQLIPCILRHLPLSSARETLTTLLPDLLSHRLSGLGLSSTELPFPPHLFTPIFTDPALTAAKVNLTAHAGEEADVSYMSSALHDLHVTRIDHGIKLTHSPPLLREFVDRQILITLCPISNLSLRCVSKISDLPVRAYLDAGVRFSINSDDPAYFGVTAPDADTGAPGEGSYVLANYCAVQEAFGLSVGEWGTIARNAVWGSWCGEERKRVLLGKVEECLARFEKGEI